MNYALGYTLNLKDLFKTFNVKKLDMTASECENIIGNRHKELVAEKVMKECINMVLQDIIHNNATFHFPTNKMEVKLKMKKTEGEEFAKARRNGKWKDVDFLASGFSGYQLCLSLQSQGIIREKPVYLDPQNKQLITDYTNNGKQYF